MTELTLTEFDMILLVGAVALFAGAVRGFTGFGGPAIMIVVLTQFYSPASVLAMVMMIDFIANLQLVPTSYRDISWRTAGPLTAASVAAIPIGLYALLAVDPMIMKQVIAAVVGLSALALLAGGRYRRPASVAALIIVGGLAGMVFRRHLHRVGRHGLSLRRTRADEDEPRQRHLLGFRRRYRYDRHPLRDR